MIKVKNLCQIQQKKDMFGVPNLHKHKKDGTSSNETYTHLDTFLLLLLKSAAVAAIVIDSACY